jgi:DNA adenine methylase
VWVNDKYYNLYCFWNQLQKRGVELRDFIYAFKMDHGQPEQAKELFNRCKVEIGEQKDEFEIAWRFYIINKCSFSGLTENSTFSELSSIRNWTLNNIDTLEYYHGLIKNWTITNLDYRELINDDPDTFIFLDPPYDLKKDYTLSGGDGDKLYGKKGNMHQGFDHVDFREQFFTTRSMCMITYNSNPNIRELFSDWGQVEWDLTYSMNNGHKSYEEAQKDRKELLLTNYEKRSINTLEAFFE